ncbi:translation initiation factor IF-2-like [Microtus oregoni]|uniref:translation initiation factor IF-2-like n=1 Tax=Microtus oregoni TaxID=111838 RepID=UPI001BB23840|nr:translation initiation factor IF-2-like [Microtus oregoni]
MGGIENNERLALKPGRPSRGIEIERGGVLPPPPERWEGRGEAEPLGGGGGARRGRGGPGGGGAKAALTGERSKRRCAAPRRAGGAGRAERGAWGSPLAVAPHRHLGLCLETRCPGVGSCGAATPLFRPPECQVPPALTSTHTLGKWAFGAADFGGKGLLSGGANLRAPRARGRPRGVTPGWIEPAPWLCRGRPLQAVFPAVRNKRDLGLFVIFLRDSQYIFKFHECRSAIRGSGGRRRNLVPRSASVSSKLVAALRGPGWASTRSPSARPSSQLPPAEPARAGCGRERSRRGGRAGARSPGVGVRSTGKDALAAPLLPPPLPLLLLPSPSSSPLRRRRLLRRRGVCELRPGPAGGRRAGCLQAEGAVLCAFRREEQQAAATAAAATAAAAAAPAPPPRPEEEPLPPREGVAAVPGRAGEGAELAQSREGSRRSGELRGRAAPGNRGGGGRAPGPGLGSEPRTPGGGTGEDCSRADRDTGKGAENRGWEGQEARPQLEEPALLRPAGRQAQFSPAAGGGGGAGERSAPASRPPSSRPLLGSAPRRPGRGRRQGWAAGSGGGGRSRRGLASAPGIFRARRDSWAVAASLALVGGSGAGDRLGRFSSAARLPGRAATALGGWKWGRSGNPDLVPGGGAAATLPGWRRLRCVRVPAGLRRRGEPAGGKREEETG